jgi:hypothetical protein
MKYILHIKYIYIIYYDLYYTEIVKINYNNHKKFFWGRGWQNM